MGKPPAVRGIVWCRRLVWLALVESRLKDAFGVRDRSRESIVLYHKYGLKLIASSRYRTDATAARFREFSEVNVDCASNHSRGRGLATKGQPTVSTLLPLRPVYYLAPSE